MCTSFDRMARDAADEQAYRWPAGIARHSEVGEAGPVDVVEPVDWPRVCGLAGDRDIADVNRLRMAHAGDAVPDTVLGMVAQKSLP